MCSKHKAKFCVRLVLFGVWSSLRSVSSGMAARGGNRFASEAYEVGNANMEYDAALDAMTIDAGHENALGMEGVDVYQNQLAKLSGSLESMSSAEGIDFDGDGQVDIAADKPGALMKYSEFKPPGQMVALGISMGPSGDPTCDIPDYAPEANGIIPGYAGHIPRARDKYGGSAHGGCSLAVHGQKHIGPQIAHEKAAVLGNAFGSDGLPLPPEAVEPVFDNYQTKVQGVMPGCERLALATHAADSTCVRRRTRERVSERGNRAHTRATTSASPCR